MENDRSVMIQIDGEDYKLVLTTGATRAIGARYGNLEKLGEKLMHPENVELALEEICWLVALLANQSILAHNHKHPDDKKEPVTPEVVELFTTPVEVASYREALTEAIYRGTVRHIPGADSGDDKGKNKAGE